jgi:hypothetical protein
MPHLCPGRITTALIRPDVDEDQPRLVADETPDTVTLKPPTPSWERGYATDPSRHGVTGYVTVLPSTGQQVGETLSWFDGT